MNFGCKKLVKGIVIPRPPSMDFSYVISMNVYFDCLSKERHNVVKNRKRPQMHGAWQNSKLHL